MKNILLPLCIFSVTIFSTGCSKDDDKENPSGNIGVITGEIRLYDEFGGQLSDHSNMRVSVLGGATSLTNTAGVFTISGLAPGTYDLTYTKTGYGTYKRFGVVVSGASSVTTLNGIDHLGEKNTTTVSNLNATFQSIDSTYTIGCDLFPLPDTIHPRAFRIFFSKTSDVSADGYLFTPSNSWTSTTGSGVITGFTPQTLLSNGFAYGDSVYIIAYGESIRTNTYTDPVTTKKVFPNLNTSAPSNIAAFQLP